MVADTKFEKIFDKATSSTMVHEAVCLIENSGKDIYWRQYEVTSHL